MSPDPDAIAVLDRYTASAAHDVRRIRIGRMAARSKAGRALISEALRRNIAVELIGHPLS